MKKSNNSDKRSGIDSNEFNFNHLICRFFFFFFSILTCRAQSSSFMLWKHEAKYPTMWTRPLRLCYGSTQTPSYLDTAPRLQHPRPSGPLHFQDVLQTPKPEKLINGHKPVNNDRIKLVTRVVYNGPSLAFFVTTRFVLLRIVGR